MTTPLKIRTVSFADIGSSGLTAPTDEHMRYSLREWSSIRIKSQSTIE